MRRHLINLVLIVCSVAALAGIEWKAAPPPSGVLTLNGVWIGQSRRDVEAYWGKGSDAPGYLFETRSYPEGEEEHAIRVHFDKDRVCGLQGYTIKDGEFEFTLYGKLTTLLERYGQPEQVKLYRHSQGGTLEVRFKNKLVTGSILRIEPSGRLSFTDSVDSISLSPPPSLIAVRPYVGHFEIRQRPDHSSEVTIYCDGIDILL